MINIATPSYWNDDLQAIADGAEETGHVITELTDRHLYLSNGQTSISVFHYAGNKLEMFDSPTTTAEVIDLMRKHPGVSVRR
ncbi:hypothetical protein MUG78_17630 [Gordonia alkaliphila]|uniref:hypothetical protein n=1 Tax=Gordonia alkaliphila TaxID=1053547 RepID=UPI001FF66437|nr:hypothetical protein [Gordonia alkaliphila]MCK0441222.1 hypothetical protein [Gordonia alkaliphila]